MAELVATEVKALVRILGELDYYQLLHLEPGAPASRVRAAYHETSRSFHPDAHRHLETDLRDAVEAISKRVSEAYSVLRNPRLRAAYDRRIAGGGKVRMQLVEAEAEAGRQARNEREGNTPQGRQYHNLARADLTRGNLAGAERNLRTALTFEPDNDCFRAELEKLRNRSR